MCESGECVRVRECAGVEGVCVVCVVSSHLYYIALLTIQIEQSTCVCVVCGCVVCVV